ncbi:MAG: DUF481 domain-containing protein [Opitutaceae bacterium]|jgi:putative salt-induced outer membrane protein YdiY|nr:DUF481 domain-containing protein [Opitutaceae bacterium]
MGTRIRFFRNIARFCLAGIATTALLLAAGSDNSSATPAMPAATATPGHEPLVELHLANGDKLTGRIIDRRDGKIFFKSDIFGTLEVAEAKATAAPPAAAVAVPASVTPVASAPAAAAAPEKARWKGKVEFGYQQKSGSVDSLGYQARFEAQKETGPDTYRATARLLYGEQDNTKNSDRIEASLRWRHRISERFFTQTTTSYYQDAIAGIDHNFEQNAGVGYKLLQRDRHTLNIGGGITGQYRNAPEVEGGIAALAEFFEDYTLNINGHLTFLQDFNVQYWPDKHSTNATSGAGESLKTRFNATLQSKLTEKLSFNIRYEYEYDNAIADPGARTTQRIISSLGYAF